MYRQHLPVIINYYKLQIYMYETASLYAFGLHKPMIANFSLEHAFMSLDDLHSDAVILEVYISSISVNFCEH